MSDLRQPVATDAAHLADPFVGLPYVLTVDEVAKILRVDRKTVYEAVRDEALPARRLGRRILIPRDLLRAWLDGSAAHSADVDFPYSREGVPSIGQVRAIPKGKRR